MDAERPGREQYGEGERRPGEAGEISRWALGTGGIAPTSEGTWHPEYSVVGSLDPSS